MIPAEYVLIILSPIFFAFVAFEWWQTRKQQPVVYQWRDSVANFVLSAMHQFGEAVSLLLLMPLFLWLSQYAIWKIEFNYLNLLLLFVLQDFLYYWFHRASHRVRWLWASHVTHHSSRLMNFSTAFRQSLTYPISGMWLFWTPLIMLGFEVKLVISVVAINLGFQFFVHTRWWQHWGVAGYLFNTPSWHRVHHACNPRYIDKNFAGVLVIWDRMFGTFEPEDAAEPCRFGITDEFESVHPWTITFYEWRRMIAQWPQTTGFSAKLRLLFGPPQPKVAKE